MVNEIFTPVRDLKGQLMAELVFLNSITSFTTEYRPVLVNWVANKQIKKITTISLKLLNQVCLDAVKTANRRKLVEKIAQNEFKNLSEVISLVNSGVLATAIRGL